MKTAEGDLAAFAQACGRNPTSSMSHPKHSYGKGNYGFLWYGGTAKCDVQHENPNHFWYGRDFSNPKRAIIWVRSLALPSAVLEERFKAIPYSLGSVPAPWVKLVHWNIYIFQMFELYEDLIGKYQSTIRKVPWEIEQNQASLTIFCLIGITR